MNGTLRDDENLLCQNCGVGGHRKYECPEPANTSTDIICRVCAIPGHMARDCTAGKDLNVQPSMSVLPLESHTFDSEYATLMGKLGETSREALKSSWPVAADVLGGNTSRSFWHSDPWLPSDQQGGYRNPQTYGSYGTDQWGGYTQGGGF